MTNPHNPDQVVVAAAMDLAADIADGKLHAADLHPKAVAMAREVCGLVIGPQDPMWPLQCDIARQVIGLGGFGADELGEWTAVFRAREGGTAGGGSWVERALAADDTEEDICEP